MPEATQRNWLTRLGSLGLGSLFVLALLTCLVTRPAGADEAVSQNFRLIGQTSLMAAGRTQSAGFQLQSCVDGSPAGIGSSPSFHLSSGCLPLIQSVTDVTPPDVFPSFPQKVPLLDGWMLAMLIIMLATVAWPSHGGRRV